MNYTQQLRDHHLKVTPQRLEIAQALEHYGHLTIDTLYTILKKKFDSISLATIYKNINLMTQNAFIQEVKIPQAKSVYELTKASHSHLVCDKCHQVEDITLDLSMLVIQASKTSEFQIEKTSLVFNGICSKCQ